MHEGGMIIKLNTKNRKALVRNKKINIILTN